MWVFAECGFYSAVDAGKGKVKVRARVKKHLTALIARCKLDVQIQETTGTDYRYRIILDKVLWVDAVTQLADAIDYPNFKGRVSKTRDKAYEHALHEVWSTMYSLQPRR